MMTASKCIAIVPIMIMVVVVFSLVWTTVTTIQSPVGVMAASSSSLSSFSSFLSTTTAFLTRPTTRNRIPPNSLVNHRRSSIIWSNSRRRRRCLHSSTSTSTSTSIRCTSYNNNNNNNNSYNNGLLLDAIEELFPSQQLQERIALSRKDGYWPYISTGQEPPSELVYGEYDIEFFLYILHQVRTIKLLEKQQQQQPDSENDNHDNEDGHNDLVFCDLGSGTGKLVLAAAAAYTWKLCRGLELLPGIHQEAVQRLQSCSTTHSFSMQPNHNNNDTIVNDDAMSEPNDSSTTSIDRKKTTTTISTSDPTKEYWKQYLTYTTPNSNNTEWMNQFITTTTTTTDLIQDLHDTIQNNEIVKETTILSSQVVMNTTNNQVQEQDDEENNIYRQEEEDDDEENNNDDDVDTQDDPIMAKWLPKIKSDTAMLPDTTTTSSLSCIMAQSFSTQEQHDQQPYVLRTGRNNNNITLSPIQFNCGSFQDPNQNFGDSDIVFCFSSAMPNHTIQQLAQAIGRQCHSGTLVITTEYPLPLTGILQPVPIPSLSSSSSKTLLRGKEKEDSSEIPSTNTYQLELVEEYHGPCDTVGGISTAYVHRVL